MAEGKMPFSLDLARFQEVWNPPGFNLQHEFKTKEVSLSQSLLIWEKESGKTWLLADFENKKTYDIERADDTEENQTVKVRERPSEAEQPVTLEGAEAILSHLQSARGTDQGFIDLLKRLNLDELNLEGLKRSDLSGAGFSFESVHQDLLTVHSMLRKILTPSHEWVLDFSRGVAQGGGVREDLRNFYENVRKIEDFKISDENPKQAHARLLQEISQFCDSAKESLRHIVAYLSSRKVEQLGAEVNDTVATAVDRLNIEADRAKENNDEVEKKEAERQQKFDQLELEMQNQLLEKPISQYKAIFAEQAKEYRKGAWIWLGMAGVATAAFFGVFFLLPTLLKPGGNQLTKMTEILQSLFTKGLLLSPIYMWLNRSIKNYTAQKHLEVINTHRQKALETFDTFVAAAEGNRETRDAVLLSATEAIFDANQSGYLSAKASGSDSKSPIQQVIREIIPEKSSTKGS